MLMVKEDNHQNNYQIYPHQNNYQIYPHQNNYQNYPFQIIVPLETKIKINHLLWSFICLHETWMLDTRQDF